MRMAARLTLASRNSASSAVNKLRSREVKFIGRIDIIFSIDLKNFDAAAIIGAFPQHGDAAMSAAANKKLLQDIFAAAANPDPAARDRALFTTSLAEDAKWIVTGQYSWSRTFSGKAAILNDLHGYVRSRLRDRTRTVAHRFIADGDVVVVEAKGDNVTPEGVRYDNDYCLVFRLEDGRIKEIREYCDSILTEKALGPFPQAQVRAAS
jgi:ketosteroid isomerase-like protein